MKAYDDFRQEVIQKYHADYGCGQDMSLEEIGHEFDLTIGKSGYDDMVRVEKIYDKRGEAFDPVKSATEKMDALI